MFKVGDKVLMKGYDGYFTIFSITTLSQGVDLFGVVDSNGYYYFTPKEYLEHFFKEENKQPTFSIKEGSIESAARFIVANNNYQPYSNIEECSNRIKRCISRMVERIKRGEEAYRCSTAGWTVLIGLEDEDYYVVEVLVDSSVSQDREFVNVEEVI